MFQWYCKFSQVYYIESRSKSDGVHPVANGSLNVTFDDNVVLRLFDLDRMTAGQNCRQIRSQSIDISTDPPHHSQNARSAVSIFGIYWQTAGAGAQNCPSFAIATARLSICFGIRWNWRNRNWLVDPFDIVSAQNEWFVFAVAAEPLLIGSRFLVFADEAGGFVALAAGLHEPQTLLQLKATGPEC